MKKQVRWLVLCFFSVALFGGCASTGGILHSPLPGQSVAKQAEKDPFPEASQVGLAQK